MTIIEPHIHMYSRTTDDYVAMYNSGIRACVEPSFWMGCDRRFSGTFFDYFQLILEFETVRAGRFGIDHFAAVSLNPKETENVRLADEVIAGLNDYIDHPRCVAIGEIGFNNLTPNEERAFTKQLRLAAGKNMLVIVHLPHFNKPAGIKKIVDIIKVEGVPQNKILLDHNTEDTVEQARQTECYCGFTVYPISKLTPQRVSDIIRRFGPERMIIDGSADWGISDPLSLPKTADFLGKDGHPQATIQKILFDNAMSFYGQCPKWKPNLDIKPMDPREFQR